MSYGTGKSNSSGATRSLIGIGVSLLLLLSVTTAGCSLMYEPTVQPLVEQVPSATPTITPTSTPSWPDAWTPTPTFTPWPTMTPTTTPTPTFTPTATRRVSGPGGTSGCRPGASKGPLTLDFEVKSAWCPAGIAYRAVISVWAEGGDGCYTYYRDIDKIGGPTSKAVTYELDWTTCGGAPGTFTVKSGDQEVSKKFWIRAPTCC